MRLVAEWEEQAGVQLIWPDETTPWEDLDKVQECYSKIISYIIKYEKLLLITSSIKECKSRLIEISNDIALNIELDKIIFFETEINDTWARDNGGIAVLGDNNEKYLYDFVFNGWGQKFASDKDNQITKKAFFSNIFRDDVMCVDMRPFVLEGGSIDCDGAGTLLTTKECLLSINRNEYLEMEEIEGELKQAFGLKRVLWLDEGKIKGDDTDSHVDILARFCNENTIAYVSTEDKEDPDYEALKKMELQLKSFRTLTGKPYNLIALPQAEPMYLEDYKLPSSYANFLIINNAVLVPATMTKADKVVKERLQKVFNDRKIIMIDCRPLLSGHGGLHCITMQFPKGYL